jgi:hypothetical protein
VQGTGAEGATAPETLRQKDRWSSNALESRTRKPIGMHGLTEGVTATGARDPRAGGKSLRSSGQRGCV